MRYLMRVQGTKRASSDTAAAPSAAVFGAAMEDGEGQATLVGLWGEIIGRGLLQHCMVAAARLRQVRKKCGVIVWTLRTASDIPQPFRLIYRRRLLAEKSPQRAFFPCSQRSMQRARWAQTA